MADGQEQAHPADQFVTSSTVMNLGHHQRSIMDLAHPGLSSTCGSRGAFDGLRCFEAWGLHYHCLLTWVKPPG
jgi:hypothetical protein